MSLLVAFSKEMPASGRGARSRASRWGGPRQPLGPREPSGDSLPAVDCLSHATRCDLMRCSLRRFRRGFHVGSLFRVRVMFPMCIAPCCSPYRTDLATCHKSYLKFVASYPWSSWRTMCIPFRQWFLQRALPPRGSREKGYGCRFRGADVALLGARQRHARRFLHRRGLPPLPTVAAARVAHACSRFSRATWSSRVSVCAVLAVSLRHCDLSVASAWYDFGIPIRMIARMSNLFSIMLPDVQRGTPQHEFRC